MPHLELLVVVLGAMLLLQVWRLYLRHTRRCCHRAKHYSLWCEVCEGALCEYHRTWLVRGNSGWRCCPACYAQAKTPKEGET